MNEIVSLARKWLGTRFHHQGRRLGVGVDCIGLITGVAQDLGIKFVDQTSYARSPKDNELQEVLEKYLNPSPLKIGCVALFKLEQEPQHVGIITDYGSDGFGLIHAYAQARKVVEHNLDESWRSKLVATYRYPLAP